MRAQVGGKTVEFAQGTPWKELIATPGALGVSVGGSTFSLDAPAQDGVQAHVLTYADEEGRRIYERTLELMFLAAAQKVIPGRRVRFEHSFGDGIFVRLPKTTVTRALAARIEREMRDMAERDLPIPCTQCTKEEANAYFAATGQTDKLRLFQYRQLDTFRFYGLEGVKEYFYGEMAPSTGCASVFQLRLYLPGLLLRWPAAGTEGLRMAPFADMPKLMKAFGETGRMNGILGCENAADLNESIGRRGFRDLIRVSEAIHERHIGQVADQILRSGARVVLIAGPSSSGKTTFAHRLIIALRALGLRPMKLSLDDYYRDRADLPLEADGRPDLERLDTLDVPLTLDRVLAPGAAFAGRGRGGPGV